VPNPVSATFSGVKAGQTVGGEHHESKAFWSHDRVGDVVGGKRRSVEFITIFKILLVK